MNPTVESSGPSPAESGWKIALAAAVIVLAGVVAYHDSFSGPFVFDDPLSITQNPTIQPPWSIGTLLSPPVDTTVGGRPVANLTLGLNYALGGTEVQGYHLINLIIHLLAGLTLFGVVRRTLLLAGRGRRTPPDSGTAAFGDAALRSDATLLALAVAVLWTVHPLQTEAVAYVVQRTESLMALFYLLTLYCFIRGAAGDGHSAPPRWIRIGWYGGAVAACLLGMGSKEVMVSAPVLVLLHDRTFVAGSFRAAWRRRRALYLGLAATWLGLAYLVVSLGGNRGGTTGIAAGASLGAYALTQFPAVLDYLRLAFWPHPLVFDYGAEWVKDPADIFLPAVALVLLVAGTVWALWRRPVPGFLGAWFFAILAPTSLVPGPRQTMAEHRMYLALAAVISLAVVAARAWGGRRTLVAWFALAAGLAGLTLARLEVYRTELSLWADTVAKRPDNRWGQSSLGLALCAEGRAAEALPHLERGAQLAPRDPGAHTDLGLALAKLGRLDEAVREDEAALRLRPSFAGAHNNLGVALTELNRPAEALQHLETAARLQPGLPTLDYNLGNALLRLGRVDQAIQRFQAALRQNPRDAAACANLGNALAQTGRPLEAIQWFERASDLDPDDPTALFNLATMLARVGRTSEAIARFQAVLRLRPGDLEAQQALIQLQGLR